MVVNQGVTITITVIFASMIAIIITNIPMLAHLTCSAKHGDATAIVNQFAACCTWEVFKLGHVEG